MMPPRLLTERVSRSRDRALGDQRAPVPVTLHAVEELRNLYRYRQLIAALTARDLKARYRGSILGFFWSLANPLLLLTVYTVVFTFFFPSNVIRPYPLFLFSGILPWTFFSAAILESTTAISSGWVTRKTRWPATTTDLDTTRSRRSRSDVACPRFPGS